MLQVDLPMPKSCDVCPFNYDFICCNAISDEEWEKVGDDWNWNVCDRDDRPEYCPLKEIVMCKDCKYAEVDMCCSHPSEWNNSETRNHNNPNWFCADGERRTGDV